MTVNLFQVATAQLYKPARQLDVLFELVHCAMRRK